MSDKSGTSKWLLIIAAGVVAFAFFGNMPDVLKGMSSNHEHSSTELQAIVTAFCFSPIVSELLRREDRPTLGGEGGTFTFEEDGDIENDDYVQSSIYSLLYALYKNTQLTSPHGVKYTT